MKVYWWNGGLHVEPEDDTERTALGVVVDSLNVVEFDQEVLPRPVGVIDPRDEHPVVGVDELEQVVKERLSGDAVGPTDSPLRQ